MLARASLIGLLAALAWLPCAAPAAAKPETEQEVQERLARTQFARGGFYLAGEGLAAIENSPLIGGDSFIVSGGFDVRLGHRHNRWLATEISGMYVHTYGDAAGKYLAWGMTMNERFYLTRRRVQPFVTAGAGFLQLESRGSNPDGTTSAFDPKFAMLFGFGTEIFVNENFAVTVMANYHKPFAGSSQLDFLTAGLGFVFF